MATAEPDTPPKNNEASTLTWPAAGRALLQPPSEVLYVVPVAGLIAITAAASNDLVARAIYFILGGCVVAASSWVVAK